MSELKLITSRRNFLIRALGFTAAGATLPIGIVAADDPRARITHHQAELEKAWRDYYGTENVGGILVPETNVDSETMCERPLWAAVLRTNSKPRTIIGHGYTTCAVHSFPRVKDAVICFSPTGETDETT
jgi:hypothetical protein